MNFKIVHIALWFLLIVNCAFAQHRMPVLPETLSLSDFPKLSEEIVTYFENHGYPFASVSLKSADPEHGDMTPKIVIDTSIFVTFDSIILKGDVKLSPHFLYPYLGLRRGMPYNEQLMQAIAGKLAELPYATIAREPGVSFVKDKAYLYVYLNQRRVNQFDGYIGLVPTD
ncbi:MAG: hypothetical protein MJZ57_09050, partial [Bacteroidales bacterium]|nr:hypothetical protein [Bacteroidales bacterium]